MADLIRDCAEQLLQGPVDPVPRYRLMRDVLGLAADDPDLLAARDLAWRSGAVQELLAQQLDNGSWGRFYSRNKVMKNAGRTTETAIIRALALGLDLEHPALRQVVSYLESILRQEADWPDYTHEFQTMPLARQLVTAARLRSLDPLNPLALAVADQWARIIQAAFVDGDFDAAQIDEASEAVFGESLPANCPLCFSSYQLLLLRERLPYAVEKSWINYVVQRSRGVAYLTNRSLNYMPLLFPSQEAMRYIAVMDHLAWYPSAADVLQQSINWLWDQQRDCIWDFGQVGRDGLELPLSSSWRILHNRAVDSSTRAMAILVRLQRTCDLYRQRGVTL
jgi:hypothetical protein